MANQTIVLLKNKSTPQDPYEEAFRAAGFDPVFVPMLHHEPVNLEKSRDFLSNPSFLESDAFIITSQRAVEIMKLCVLQLNTSTQREIFDKTCFTIGPATHRVLQDAGFKDLKGGMDAGNGSILADIIQKELSADSKIVFLTGEIRKDIIPRKLRAEGYNLVEEVIYQTSPRSDIELRYLEIQGSKEEPWVVFFSPQGTDPILKCITLDRIACIGPTTDEYLREKGIVPLVVAEKPQANALLAAINDYGK